MQDSNIDSIRPGSPLARRERSMRARPAPGPDRTLQGEVLVEVAARGGRVAVAVMVAGADVDVRVAARFV